MLCSPDVQEFGLNNYHYLNKEMKECLASGLNFYPKQGKFKVGDKTVELYLYNNPWTLYSSNILRNTEAINSVFQYCVVCKNKNFADEDFENLGEISFNNLNLINCDKHECQLTILKLLNEKKFVQAILDKNADELKKYIG